MVLRSEAWDQYQVYVATSDTLTGDQRTKTTFAEVIWGIIGSDSLCASRIARFSPKLARSRWADKRVRRMATGESTGRSRLDADSLTAVLREEAIARLRGEADLMLVLDGMELRRAGATAQAGLMRVKGLDGKVVTGYRSVNVLGLGAGERRGLLYHHLFSSQQPDF